MRRRPHGRYIYVEHYRAEVATSTRASACRSASARSPTSSSTTSIRDPQELQNLASDIAYAQTRAALAEALAGLRCCSGADC